MTQMQVLDTLLILLTLRIIERIAALDNGSFAGP